MDAKFFSLYFLACICIKIMILKNINVNEMYIFIFVHIYTCIKICIQIFDMYI